MKKNSEEHIHIYVASFLRKLQAKGLDFIFFHIPNGGGRSKQEGGKFKLMGVLPGVPDLCVMKDGCIFFIELKATLGRQSTVQENFIQDARKYGFKTFILKAATPQEAITKATNILKEFFADHQTIDSVASSMSFIS